MNKFAFIIIVSLLSASMLLVTITIIASRADNRIVTGKIQTALRSGEVIMPSAWNRDLKTGTHTWADCQVLEIATYGQKDIVSALTRAEYVPYDSTLPIGEGGHPCDRLSDKVGPQPPEKPHYDYWRYWWGNVSMLNIALGIGGISLPAYQSALKSSSYAVIVLVGVAALVRYRRAALPFLPVVVALLFGFGLPLFGQSIADAPGLIAGMLLLLIYMIAKLDRAPPAWQFIYVFTVGGVACFFELLDGNSIAVLICFILIRIISSRAFGSPEVIWPKRLRAWPASIAVVSLMAAYLGGMVSMVLLRILLRMTLLGQSVFAMVSDWKGELSKYTVSNWVSRTGVPYTPQTKMEMLYGCYYNIEVGTYPFLSRHMTVLIYAACGLGYLIIGGWLVRHARKLEVGDKDMLAAAALAVVIVPLWYGIFAVHTMIHFWMMGRLLALFFALAPSVALFLMDRRPDRITSSSGAKVKAGA